MNNVKETHEIPIKLKCLLLIAVATSKGESAKEVMLRKCKMFSLSSASNFSCSKREELLALAANLSECF